jgi:uncharacterized protein YcbX
MRLMMQLAGIWPYPVKSMRGESLDAVSLSREGVFGDCIVQASTGKAAWSPRERIRRCSATTAL